MGDGLAPPDLLHPPALFHWSARFGSVLLADLLGAGSEDGFEEFLAVPNLQGLAVNVDVNLVSGPMFAAADLLPGHTDDPVGGDPAGDPVTTDPAGGQR